MGGTKVNRIIALAAGAALLAVHYHIFSQFFPNFRGKLGQDYSFVMPSLLDGFFWKMENGIFSIQWFTPSFCGGIPKFPNPIIGYNTVPQLLTFYLNPLLGIKLTLLIFAAAGFCGAFALLRSIFLLDLYASLLGATLFLFNGFYSHTMLIGHLENHSFMLIPILIFFLLRPFSSKPQPFFSGGFLTNALLAGLVISYMIYSGAAKLLPPIALATVASCMIFGIFHKEKLSYGKLAAMLGIAFVSSLALSAVKIVASLSYLRNFPRDYYSLPGIPDLWDLLNIAMTSLFWKPAFRLASDAMVNGEWALFRHEFEFGITIVPLVILLAGATLKTYGLFSATPEKGDTRGHLVKISIIVILLFIPIAVNYYSPHWNSLLKSMPVLKGTSNFFRWFCVYIPVLILLSSALICGTPLLARHSRLICVAGIIVVIGLNASADRKYYHLEKYDPSPILDAFSRYRHGDIKPNIHAVSAVFNPAGEIVMSNDGGNSIAKGEAPMLCYEPVFGYRLEKFPFKTLHPGPVMETSEGALNIKNPACFVFPDENACRPGDHFPESRKDDASSFAHYGKFPYQVSTSQRYAYAISGASLLGYLLYFSIIPLMWRWSKK